MDGETNREWHAAHSMPKNPTTEQRVEWHLAHSEACGCRKVPDGLQGRVAALRKSRGDRRSN